MQTGSFDKLSGEVEVDETYIGGKARNMHGYRHPGKNVSKGGRGKQIVAGMLERSGEVRAIVVPDNKGRTLRTMVNENIADGSTVYTDNNRAYIGLEWEYDHRVIDHAQRYVDGRIHTNGLENFWALLKRGLHGTYVSVEPFHLFRYIDERAFTYNMRELTDLGRFSNVLAAVAGRRITYAELIGQR
jgi:transposase-like protein